MEDDIGIDSEDVLVSRSVQMDNSTQNERARNDRKHCSHVASIRLDRARRGIDESRWRKTVLVSRPIREGKGREMATVLARGETAGRGGERESVKGKGEGRRGFPVSGALIHFILCAVKRRSIKVEKSERDSGTRVAEWRGKGSRRRRGGGGSTLGGGDKTRVGTVARRCGHSKVETVFSCLPLRTDNGEARGFNVNAGNPFLTLSRHQYRNEFFLPHKGALLLRDTRTEFHPVWNHRASSLFARTFELRLRGLTSPSRGSSMIIFE